MAMGFQAFIKGTSYDVLNSMGYNFVVEVLNISGTGSKTYNLPGFNLAVSLLGSRTTQGSSVIQYNASVSGQTVSWSGIDSTSRLIVFASANSTINYFGFSLNDYTSNPATFKLAPNFTPFNLVQVIDLTPGFNQLVQTVVPAGQACIIFHRSLGGSGFNHVWWQETTSNGKQAIRFRPNFGAAMGQTRLYIFAKMMVNTPTHGFFLYAPGTSTVVWHSNCLPLNMVSSGITGSSTPVATTSGVSIVVSLPYDPAFPNTGQTRYNCFSAGMNSNGTYSTTASDIYAVADYQTPTGVPPAFVQGPPGSIRTDIYDRYYRLALGYD